MKKAKSIIINLLLLFAIVSDHVFMYDEIKTTCTPYCSIGDDRQEYVIFYKWAVLIKIIWKLNYCMQKENTNHRFTLFGFYLLACIIEGFLIRQMPGYAFVSCMKNNKEQQYRRKTEGNIQTYVPSR